MGIAKNEKEAAAATRATDAIRKLGAPSPKQPSVAEDLQKAAPKPRRTGMGLIISALILLILVSSLGGIYLAGRLNPSVRTKLQAIPLVGKYVFPQPKTTTNPQPAAQPETTTGKIPTPEVSGSEIGMALQGLKEAEAKFAADKKVYDKQQADLKAAQDKLKQDQAALDKAKQDFAKQQADAEQALKTLDKVVQSYSSMKPADVATRFDGLADDDVVQILLRMDPTDAGKVLAALDPWRAARLTERMLPGSAGASATSPEAGQ